MAYGAGVDKATNALALAINLFVDSGTLIQQTRLSYPVLTALMGEAIEPETDRFGGKRLAWKRYNRDSGAKIQLNVNGVEIGLTPLTSGTAAFTPSAYSGPLGLEFDWAEYIQNATLLGSDLRRIASGEKISTSMVEAAAKSIIAGKLSGANTLIWNVASGATTVAKGGNMGSIPNIVSDGLAASGEGNVDNYGLTRSDPAHTFFRSVMRTSAGAISLEKLRGWQQAVRDNGGRGDLVALHSDVHVKVASTMVENLTQVQYDENLTKLGAPGILYNNSLVVADPGVRKTLGPPDTYDAFVLTTDDWRLYDREYKAGDTELMDLPQVQDAKRMKRVTAMQLLCVAPKNQLKAKGVTLS
jgi:hypothetical protein